MKPPRLVATVPTALDGRRLDQALPVLASGLSRARARRLIDGGAVFVDGKRARVCSRPVRAGATLVCHDLARPAAVAPPRVVLEDGGTLVIDKPAGMAVEPTRAGVAGTVTAWLRSQGRVGLVTHRLDAATSGLLVLACEPSALAAWNALFARHAVRRRYLAVVSPAPDWARATLDGPLDGRPARTRVRAIGRSPTAALLVVDLETGRTRQIRRHLSAAGVPVVGDRDARASQPAVRLLLHAFSIEADFRGRIVAAHAPPPPSFVAEATRFGLPIPGEILGFR